MKLLFFSILVVSFFSSCSQQKIDANDPNIYYTGRIDFSDPKVAKFAWPGTSVKAKFEGKKCAVKLNGYGYYNILVDGEIKVVEIKGRDTTYTIESLNGGAHTIEVFKRTEGFVGNGEFKGFELEHGKKLLPVEKLKHRIEFIGNSITCGYGNEGESEFCHFTPITENHYMAYAAITARSLKAEHHVVAFSGKGLTRNYDMTTTETMPDLYDRIFPFEPTIKWDFNKWTPDAVVINLGTNDFAHTNPDSTEWVNAYLNFIKTIRSHYPQAYIFCTNGPMANDKWPEGHQALTILKKYINAVVEKAQANGDTKIASFFYTSQAPPFGCDYHPSVKTHQKMADELTPFIKQKLNW